MSESPKIIKIIEEINEMFFSKIEHLDTMHQLSFVTDGYYQLIEFCDHVLWQSDEDPREFSEEKNEYEDLKTFIINEFNNFILELNEFYIINDSYRKN